MDPLNRTSTRLCGFVGELDDKLAASRTQTQAGTDPVAIVRSERKVPAWLGFAAVTLPGIGIGAVVVRPWQERCSYERDVCAVAQLDIDALRITIPNSEVIATSPNIDALDPNDELTAGDIFAMERFAHLNFAELLTDEDLDRLFRASD